MEKFIKYVHIKNFKSIADLKLEDCKRINLFIGYPNVGKSNVLEALGLFSTPYLKSADEIHKLVRFEYEKELLYKGTADGWFTIETNLHSIRFDDIIATIEEHIPMWEWHSNVFKYDFRVKNQWHSAKNPLLLPPFGENIIDTLSFNQHVGEVKAWIKNELSKRRLELVFDRMSSYLKVQERLNEDTVFQLPYSSIADTLQRVIFYKTAIASNKDSVLLFEEPEAHAFPPYIKSITQDIIDATTNQFFIVTHSPFIVSDFLQYDDVRKEVAIYLFDFKNEQTTVKRLTDEEMDEVYNYDVDLFFNIERFLRDE
jgi:AAA15 family ATPase/GTPase